MLVVVAIVVHKRDLDFKFFVDVVARFTLLLHSSKASNDFRSHSFRPFAKFKQ